MVRELIPEAPYQTHRDRAAEELKKVERRQTDGVDEEGRHFKEAVAACVRDACGYDDWEKIEEEISNCG